MVDFLGEAEAAHPGLIRSVPLFNGCKAPMWMGWRGEKPLEAARRYMEEQTGDGKQVKLTGRFADLRGWGVVIDCEGRKWGDADRVAGGWPKGEPLPAWLQAVLSCAQSGSLPSWVSAGGDGGRGVRNVLIPFMQTDVAAAIGAPLDKQRMPIGEEGKGELLLKFGVCMPKTSLWANAGGDSSLKTGTVDWADECRDYVEAGYDAVVERARLSGVMPHICEVLSHAIKDFEQAVTDGRIMASTGGGDGNVPMVAAITEALAFHGPVEGRRVTLLMIDTAGASRHYAVHSWTNWAMNVHPEKFCNLQDGLDEFGEFVYSYWAREAGFTLPLVMKAVRSEAKYLLEPKGLHR